MIQVYVVKRELVERPAENLRLTAVTNGRVGGPENGNGRRYHVWSVLLTVIALAVLPSVRSVAATVPVQVTLGQSLVNLNGPWKFHIGDDATWADPNFDDSTWAAIDLTSPPGARDHDVGLTGFVARGRARGH